jgi:hypothetical protein
MNKQLQEAQKRVEKITAELETDLGLNLWWRIKHTFSELPEGAEAGGASGTGVATRTTAMTSTLWHYRQAEITWFLPSVASIDDDYLEWVAVHEYVHILNDPLASFLFDYLRDDESTTEQLRTLGHHANMTEFVTENLCRVIQKARGKEVPA